MTVRSEGPNLSIILSLRVANIPISLGTKLLLLSAKTCEAHPLKSAVRLFCSLAARQAHPRMSSHRQAGERDKVGMVVFRCIVTIGLV